MFRSIWCQAQLGIGRGLRPVRRLIDRSGRYGGLRAWGARQADAWRQNVVRNGGGVGDWLKRPGGGSLWFPTRGAGEWAADTWTPEDQTIAAAAANGVFDLLGSGPVALGSPPCWRRDLYTGFEWPLQEASRVYASREPGADIRTVWELSRCYHFLPLARAFWKSSDLEFARTFQGHVTSWLEQNPVGYGPHWASPMDVAIRSANWVMAIVLFAPVVQIPLNFWQRMVENLYVSGRYIERYLEWHPRYRGNHFIADIVGLVYLGTLFRDDPVGARWLRSGRRHLEHEIRYQVTPDGVSLEGALGYHRLVTELFTYGGELVARNLPGGASPEYRERVRRMQDFIATYLGPDGRAPLLGDADDGRLHHLDARGWRDPRRHAAGLPVCLRAWDSTSARDGGGFCVLSAGRSHAVMRCGPLGIHGAGSHDHNDQLTVDLWLAGRPIVMDSGTFTYTRDLDARYAFRRTAAHSVIQLAEQEQNPILVGRPWRVGRDRTRSEVRECGADEHGGWLVAQHRGYEHLSSRARVARSVRFRDHGEQWEIVDEVVGRGWETVAWRLHLAPCEARARCLGAGEEEVVLSGEPPVTVRVSYPSEHMRFDIHESELSERYGAKVARPCLYLSGSVPLPLRVRVVLTPERA